MQCPTCGSYVADRERQCDVCGAAVVGTASDAASNAVAEAPDPSEAAQWPRVGAALFVCFVAELVGMSAFAGSALLGAMTPAAAETLAVSLAVIGLGVAATALRIVALVRLRKTPRRSGAFGAGSKALLFTCLGVAVGLGRVLLVLLDPSTFVTRDAPNALAIALATLLALGQTAFAVAAYLSVLGSLGRLGAYLGDDLARRRASHATTLLVALVAGALAVVTAPIADVLVVQIVLGLVGLAFAGLYLWLLARLALRARHYAAPAAAF